MSDTPHVQPSWGREKCHQRCAELMTFYLCQNTARILLGVGAWAPLYSNQSFIRLFEPIWFRQVSDLWPCWSSACHLKKKKKSPGWCRWDVLGKSGWGFILAREEGRDILPSSLRHISVETSGHHPRWFYRPCAEGRGHVKWFSVQGKPQMRALNTRLPQIHYCWCDC